MPESTTETAARTTAGTAAGTTGTGGTTGSGRQALRVDSALESVVVHSSGAVCTRRARCTLPAPEPGAPVRVRLEGLPVTLYEHSLRGRVLSGPEGLRVTDARLDVEARLQRSDELPALRLDLEDAQDRQSGARIRRDTLAAEIKEVAAFRAVPPQPKRGDPPRWAPVESILALAGFVDNRLGRLHERLRTAEDELRLADHDVDVLTDRIARLSSAVPAGRAQESAAAVLTLDRPGDEGIPGGSDVEIALEYQVPGATWSPVYQLRLERATRSRGTGTAGALVLRASVAQRTGEDWTGVRLGLSTADLLRRTDLPELRSLRIGRRQAEVSVPGWREPPAGLDGLFSGYDSAVTARPRSAPPVPLPPARPGSAEYRLAPPEPVAAAAAAPAAEDMDWMDQEQSRTFGGGIPFASPPPAPGGPPPPPMSAAPAYPAAYGAPQPQPAAPRSPARARRSAARSGAPDGALPQQAQGQAPVPPPAQPQPQGPAEELLDYARLSLAGPDEWGSRGKLRPASSASNAIVTEYRRRAESVARLERPAHAVDVRHSAGSFDYRFDTAAPVDVEADGAWHTVPVCEIAVEMASEYSCVPSVDDAVYGTVLLTNTSGHALLAGPADVTVDGDFVLTAPLPTLAPGQRRRVGVGVVESVQVARRTHMRESTAGLRGGTTVLDHRVEVDIANRLPHPVVVEVRERIPVTTDKDVRIEERPAEPPWAPDDELHGDVYVRGARVWRVELEPGRTTTLHGGYEIRVPAGKALVGGNRRN